VQFLLENAVFLLIGLQMPLVVRLARAELPDRTILALCGVLLAAVLLSRIVWVLAGTALVGSMSRWLRTPVWGWAQSAVVSWAGMRGVVTLAAAFSLPAQVPRRGLILLVAFVVVVGTLLLQGLSLPWLVRRLGLRGPSKVEDALQLAALLTEVVTAGRERLDAEPTDDVPPEVLDELRARSTRRADTAWERLGRPDEEYEPPTAAYLRLRLAMLQDERVAVVRARDAGRYDQEVLHEVQSMLDVEESLLVRVELEAGALRESLGVPGPVAGCDHLTHAPLVATPLTPQGFGACLREGTTWMHLRLCLTCGEVGCCDSSPSRHARRHFHESAHPVIRSFEPGETWRWCFVDDLLG
jgi:CPA1 family monovalent cation:H+ antiporter